MTASVMVGTRPCAGLRGRTHTSKTDFHPNKRNTGACREPRLVWGIRTLGHPAKPVSNDTESVATRPLAGSVLHAGARPDVHRRNPTLPILPTEGRGRLRSGASAPKFRSFAFRIGTFSEYLQYPGSARQELTIVVPSQKSRAI